MNQTNEFREGLDELASHYQEILQLLGENPDREGLEKTPMRVAKAMQVLTRGYTQDPKRVLLDALFEEKRNHNRVRGLFWIRKPQNSIKS